MRFAPGQSWPSVTRRFHQETDFRKAFMSAKDQWILILKIDKSSGQAMFEPGSLVSEDSEYGLFPSPAIVLSITLRVHLPK